MHRCGVTIARLRSDRWTQLELTHTSTFGVRVYRCITVQSSPVQYSTVRYSTVQYSTVQYSTAPQAQHSTAQHRTAPHRTSQHSAVSYSTAQYSTAQYSTIYYITTIENARLPARSARLITDRAAVTLSCVQGSGGGDHPDETRQTVRRGSMLIDHVDRMDTHLASAVLQVM